MAAHVGRFVHQERRPQDAALDPRDRPRGARVQDRDPDVGRDVVQAVPQAAVGVTVLAQEQPLVVGVPGVVDEHLDAASAVAGGGPPRLIDPGAQLVERLLQLPQLRLLQEDGVCRADSAQVQEHAGEALGVGDRVLEHRAVRPAVVGASHERQALHRRGRGGARHENRAE